jgi:predicted enzyme related to lactoylglutathione lyase
MSAKMVHFELPAADVERAKRFWSGVGGWAFGDSAMPGMEYFMVRTDDDQGGAVYAATDETDAGSGVRVYFDTDDIDATIAKVRELGGTARDKQPIPSIGWFTHCTDSEGNAFSLFQGDESAGA